MIRVVAVMIAKQDTDDKHCDDEAIEPGIRPKGRQDLIVENNDEEPRENEENQHPQQKDTWG